MHYQECIAWNKLYYMHSIASIFHYFIVIIIIFYDHGYPNRLMHDSTNFTRSWNLQSNIYLSGLERTRKIILLVSPPLLLFVRHIDLIFNMIAILARISLNFLSICNKISPPLVENVMLQFFTVNEFNFFFIYLKTSVIWFNWIKICLKKFRIGINLSHFFKNKNNIIYFF